MKSYHEREIPTAYLEEFYFVSRQGPYFYLADRDTNEIHQFYLDPETGDFSWIKHSSAKEGKAT